MEGDVFLVIVRPVAGLGNQLFMYACARSLAHKLNTELKIDTRGIVNYRLKPYNIQATLATPEEVKQARQINVKNILSPQTDYQGDILFPYFLVDEKYFVDIADILRQEIILKEPLSSIAEIWKQKILSTACSVSLHIRRGDVIKNPAYVHIYGRLSLDYYKTCVQQLKESIPCFTVFVFSNDIKWAKENLKLDLPVEFVEGCKSDDEDFILMSLCKHNIVANSTFSWWAAWLNSNPDKKVYSPDHRGRNYGHELILPESWIKVPVDYEKSVPDDVEPLLSIIIYAEKEATVVPLLSAISSQKLKDYELIFIDNTSGLSESFYQQLTEKRRVTIQKANKAALFNRALSRSRGIFVLFLQEEDIILPEMEWILGSIYEIHINMLPDIIYSVRWLEENEDGDVIVEGIKDKKFSIVWDKSFKNLMYRMLYNGEKLQQLKTSFNTETANLSLRTKIFKRDFLKKHSVLFDENLKEDFQASFFMDALKCSENFILIGHHTVV